MATILSFLSGRQITDDDGDPQSGALLYHYQAGTTSDLTVYSNQAGTVAHAQPVVCDAGGFVPLIYISDATDWKVVVRTALGVTLHTYDNLAKAPVAASAANFAAPLILWSQKTSTNSPVALTASDAGNAYEADTTSGSIEFDLPSAASVGNGKGFVFKKTASANTLTIDPSGSETIDDVSTSLAITTQYQSVGIFSNGAEWYAVFNYGLSLVPTPTVQRFTSGSGTYTPATGARYICVTMVGGGGGGGAATTNNGTAGGTSTFGSWTTVGGNGGGANASTSATGGTGGTTGTGTLIERINGQSGYPSTVLDLAVESAGHGGSSAFGGAGAIGLNSAGASAQANSGAGGAGGSSGASNGAGGAAGEYVKFFVVGPLAPASYAVGAGGAGGTAGAQAGGTGGSGIIIVEEFY